MRIVFFTENFYEGGMDTFLISLINNWKDKNDIITLACNTSHPGKIRYLKEINNRTKFIFHELFLTKIYRENAKSKYNSKLLAKNIPKLFAILLAYTPFLQLYYIFAIKKILKPLNPDRLVVVNGAYPGGITCPAASISFGLFFSQKKSYHIIHNFTSPYNPFAFVEYFIDQLVLKFSSAIVSVSENCINSLKNRNTFRNSKKLKYIFNGTSLPSKIKEKPFKIIEQLKIPPNSRILLMLGTYEERKGHSFLIDVFKKVLSKDHDAILIFSGYGSDEEKAKIYKLIEVNNLHKKVFAFDFIRNIDDLYSITSLVLIGSQNSEAFGLTAIEAMARKIPVVSTNTGGLKEVINNGEGGFCFDVNDVNGFAQKIIQLLTNDNLYAEQSEKGYKRFIDNFTIEKMVDRYMELIKS